MKRFLGGAIAVASLALSAQSVSAQAAAFVSGGVTFPTGEYADYASAGWMAQGGVLFPVGAPGLGVGALGFYGSNNHDIDGDKTNLYGGLAVAAYTIGDPAATSPYVGAGVGLMTHSYKSESAPSFEGSESGLAAGAVAGVNVPLGGVMGFVEAMFLTGFGDVDGTHVFGANVGVQFPLGG